MQHSRLIKKFNKWQKSSKNLMKSEDLIEQVELFQFLEDEDLNSENFVEELLKADKNFSRLIKKGSTDEHFSEDW